MKREHRHLSLLLAVGIASSSFAQKGTKPLSYKQLKYPKLNEVKIPEPARYELSNGLTVFMLEDHTLPTISASVLVHTGSRYEPADKVGLAAMTGQVMRTGGTATRPGDKIDEMLDRAAASVETFIGTASGGGNLSVLKEDIDVGLAVLADILRNPAFPDEKIDLAKTQSRSGISRRNDNVGGIAAREFNRLIYGPNSPYGRIQEYGHVDNITRQDLVEFHKKYYFPNNALMAVWGDFNTEEMKLKIEKEFGSWERGAVSLPPVSQTRMAPAKTVNFIKKTDVNQSQIRLGHIGGKLNDPESAVLNLADQAFGGGFASRLFVKVRTQQGLAYSVYSSWGESYDYNGVFNMGGSTKSGTTVAMVKSILDELGTVVKSGITQSDLNYAKDSYLNSFVFEFASKAQVINKLMSLEYYGYPKDYYQQQQKKVQSATLKEVNEAIASRWSPDKVSILVVGNDGEFGEKLETLGAVKTIDITIPPPPEKIPEPTTETLAKGKEIMKRAFEAAGGAKVLAVKDLVEVMKMTMNVPQMGGDMSMDGTITMMWPDKMSNKMTTMMGEVVSAFDGTNGWMTMGGNTMDMPSQQTDAMKKQYTLHPINVFQNFDKTDYVVYYFKNDKVDGKQAQVLVVKSTAFGTTAKWYIDSTSAMLVKLVARGVGIGGSGMQEAEQFFYDYRSADGVMMPFKTTTMIDGKRQAEVIFSSIKTNTGVKVESFKKPKE
jgi:predicted Zn-dependent peptidase